MSDTKFWMVWNPYGHAPTHRHVTKASAVNEAERLARKVAGGVFVVLEAIAHVRVPETPVAWTELQAPDTDDDLPF